MSPGAGASEVVLDWRYGLGDFLHFEAWLAASTPAPGAAQLARSLDFERLRVVQRSYRVVERNSAGYLVETNAPFAATRTQLSSTFLPESMIMAEVFDIRRSTEADAVALTDMGRKARYLFELDQRLANPERLTRLVLAPDGVDADKLPRDFRLTMDRRSTAADTHVAPDSYLGETLRFPVANTRVQHLAQQALAAARADDGDLAGALIDVVHRTLRYAENRPSGSVLDSLDAGVGECTDFADLLTTVARAANLPARTIYGLAYKDGARPTLMFHAWNELFVHERWEAVDPTWPQRYADLTHIPLTDQQAARLMLAHDKQAVSFTVLDTRYAGD